MASRPASAGPALEASVALLRGVNVGGHNKIPMEELRALCAELQLRDAATYIQSGNIVFRGPAGKGGETAARIAHGIEKRFGCAVAVMVRSLEEMREAAAQNPFASSASIDPAKLLVLFLASAPLADAVAKARALPAGDDQMHLVGRHAFVYFPNGMGRPKLQVSAIERALQVAGTGRNWNTVVKLIEMAGALSA